MVLVQSGSQGILKKSGALHYLLPIMNETKVGGVAKGRRNLLRIVHTREAHFPTR